MTTTGRGTATAQDAPPGHERRWAVDTCTSVLTGLLSRWGVIGSRIGRRTVLLSGLAVSSVGSVPAATLAVAAVVVAIRLPVRRSS